MILQALEKTADCGLENVITSAGLQAAKPVHWVAQGSMLRVSEMYTSP